MVSRSLFRLCARLHHGNCAKCSSRGSFPSRHSLATPLHEMHCTRSASPRYNQPARAISPASQAELLRSVNLRLLQSCKFNDFSHALHVALFTLARRTFVLDMVLIVCFNCQVLRSSAGYNVYFFLSFFHCPRKLFNAISGGPEQSVQSHCFYFFSTQFPWGFSQCFVRPFSVCKDWQQVGSLFPSSSFFFLPQGLLGSYYLSCNIFT